MSDTRTDAELVADIGENCGHGLCTPYEVAALTELATRLQEARHIIDRYREATAMNLADLTASREEVARLREMGLLDFTDEDFARYIGSGALRKILHEMRTALARYDAMKEA